MAAPKNIWMPDGLDVGDGYTLRVTALDPTTGNVVAGAKVTTVVIEGSGTGNLNSGDFVVGNPLLIGVSI